MYQLVLGVGWDALKTRFQSYDQNPHVSNWKRIEQHKILFNRIIGEYYIEQAQQEGMNVDCLKSYIADICGSNIKSEVANVNGDTIKEIFGNYFKDKADDAGAILYGSELEREKMCSKRKCRYQFDVAKDVFEDKRNLLSLYSADNILDLKVEEGAVKYLRFISHMLADEDTVSFIDPFIAGNDYSRNEFCNTYLSMVAEGASVNVFLAENEGDTYWNELKEAANKRNINLKIFPCKKNTMHDRHITTSNVVLTIGAGILFYNSKKKIRESTVFVYHKKEINSGLEYEMRLAGGNVGIAQ